MYSRAFYAILSAAAVFPITLWQLIGWRDTAIVYLTCLILVVAMWLVLELRDR